MPAILGYSHQSLLQSFHLRKSATQAGAPLHVIRTQQFGDTCPPFDDSVGILLLGRLRDHCHISHIQTIVNFARESGGVYVDTCAKGSSNDEVSQVSSFSWKKYVIF